MGLFPFSRKNRQESAPASAPAKDEFFPRAAGEPSAATRGSDSGSAAYSRKSGKSGKEDAADPALPEKKRARRRLIGAVALVLAVVIVLPMILDSEPHPLADDMAIQIPARDGKDAKPADPSATAQPKEALPDSVAPSPTMETPAMAPSAPVAPVAEKSSENVEVPKSAVKAEVKDNDRKPDDAARALAILEGRPESVMADKKSDRQADGKAAPAAAGGRFVVQVAALATQKKIDELRRKLHEAGIKSYTQKVATQSGERTRIRIGPFASRDEADRMRARISKLGLSATIVPV